MKFEVDVTDGCFRTYSVGKGDVVGVTIEKPLNLEISDSELDALGLMWKPKEEPKPTHYFKVGQTVFFDGKQKHQIREVILSAKETEYTTEYGVFAESRFTPWFEPKPTRPFQVGDKVKVVRAQGHALPMGFEGIIDSIDKDGDFVIYMGTLKQYLCAADLELISADSRRGKYE